MIKIEFSGNCCVASGKNWHYERVGHLSSFTQTGKVPSLRVIKKFIKLYIRMNDIGARLVCENSEIKEGKVNE